MSIKCVLWDFDGVILDSMHIRDLGFVKVLSEFPEAKVNELLKYHRINGGLSRYHKFRYFFEQILSESITEEDVNKYAESFSIIMRELLTDPSNLIQDTISFIAENFDKYEFHIVSGSDQQELRFLCDKLNLSRYFVSISGSPRVKKELVEKLIGELPYSREEMVLIGDSLNDYEAASINGIEFYAYNNLALKDSGHKYIESFSKLKQI